MAKKAPITRGANVSLYGRKLAERYDDDDLAVLDGQHVEHLTMLRQEATRLPHVAAGLREIWIGENPAFVSLDGLERHTTLQRLWLTDLPALDLGPVFALCAEMPELTELRLGGKALRELPRSIGKLPSLLSVRLEDCPALDFAGAFAALGAVSTLRDLALHVGGVTISDAFAPLAQLTSLKISRGRGTVMPTIGALRELKKLDLEGSEFDLLPATIRDLAKLEELILKRTSIAYLPDELCACTALRILDCSDTPLEALPTAIGKLANLRELRLWSKKLRALPDSIGDLAELRVLHLPWEKITVPDSIERLRLEDFAGPKAVEARLTMRPPPTPQDDRLYLCDTDRIPDDFGDPSTLEIAMRGFTGALPQLAGCRRMKELTIEHGDLAVALAPLVHATNLRELTVKGEFTALPDELGALVQLTTLSIESGSTSMPDQRGTLASLSDTIGDLAALESLTLRRHRLTKLPAALGKLTALRSLALDAGELATLPDVFASLPALELFEIKLGRLERLPASLLACPRLSAVGIHAWNTTESRLANLPLVGKLPALRSLALCGMPIPLAPTIDALVGSPVEELDLRDAKLETLPPSIGGLSKLAKLHLEGTRIKRLPATLRDCSALTWISLPIHELDREVVQKIKDHLPKGRWKKHFRSWVTWFERTDA